MNPQAQYYLRFLGYAPLLPLIYLQGKRVRATVPVLPEANGKVGIVGDCPDPLQLLTLGESTVAGVGMGDHRNGFTGSIARQIADRTGRSVRYKVVARSGYNTARVRDELIPEVRDERPDLIVLGVGGNDLFQLNSPARFRQDLADLLTALRKIQPDCPVLIANLPPINTFPAFPAAMQRFFGGLVELFDRSILDLPARFPGVHYASGAVGLDWLHRVDQGFNRADLYCDGVHPSSLTYRLWGEDLVALAASRRLL